GVFFCEQGDAARGMLWLAHGLEIARGSSPALEREIRMNLSGWQHQLHHLRAVLTHPLPVRTAAFSPDGKLVVTGSHDHTARLWEAATGHPHGPPFEHPQEVDCLAFSPDGKLLATGCHDGIARLWDTRTDRPLLHRLEHGAALWDVVFT